MNKHHILNPNQFGFRQKRSCVHVFMGLMRYNIDSKRYGMTCFNDLKKAFDTINHAIVLEKLLSYGFRPGG